jgi:predicted dehydrogenase
MKPPRVALVGISGYSRVHLAHLVEMHRRGVLQFVATVVPDRPQPEDTCDSLRALGCEVLPDWDALVAALPRLRLALVIVPTPIHLHARMSLQLLGAGVNVLVEKPLAATTGEAEAVVDAVRSTGLMLAVGFQYLHAPEVQALKQRLVAGHLGTVRRIRAFVSWPRSTAYYRRNDWAGRIRTEQGWILDSPVANAMAHFFLLLLYLAGGSEAACAQVSTMTAELYRAQRIETFDTAVIGLRTADGCVLDFYGTHSAEHEVRPTVIVDGDRGRAEWVQDRYAQIEAGPVRWRQEGIPESATRERMLYDVLARVDGSPAFVCTPELAIEHIRCVNALHEHGRVTQIPAACLSTTIRHGNTFTVVTGLADALLGAFRSGTGLGAAGVPWAMAPVAIPMNDYRGLRPKSGGDPKARRV